MIEVARRDTKENHSCIRYGGGCCGSIVERYPGCLKSKSISDSHITPVNTWDEFVKELNETEVVAYWDGTETETAIRTKKSNHPLHSL